MFCCECGKNIEGYYADRECNICGKPMCSECGWRHNGRCTDCLHEGVIDSFLDDW